ncbi:MAG: shikimate dehydrogenase [Pseudomonadota bacterium]|jgi:shikimate dehydrogenase
MDKYAVFGNPIAHSQSPFIHHQFAQQTGENLTYHAECVPLDSFAQQVGDFFKNGGKGLNVTVPFKLEAFAIAQFQTDRAKIAGAINTLWIGKCGILSGDNTDGVGLLRDLTLNQSFEITGKKLLILGAGGAVRGILAPLLSECPQSIIIANRTVSKAAELATLSPKTINSCGFDDLSGQTFDLIINGISSGLHGKMPNLPKNLFNNNGLAYDMVYGNRPTPFMEWATKQEIRAVDGLGMLVEQAAEAFFIWRGVYPQTASVISQLRQIVSGVH